MDNQKENNFYELTVLLREEDPEVVEGLVENSGGQKVDVEKVVKVDLAYEVQEENSAFMSVLTFNLPSRAAPDLNKALNMEKDVLRHLLLRLEKEEKSSNRQQRETATKRKRTPKDGSTKSDDKKTKSTAQTLTNEALEEKIEEMQ